MFVQPNSQRNNRGFMVETRSPALIGWLEKFVSEVSSPERTERFVEQADDVILSRNPDVARDAALVLDLHNSTRSQWRVFLLTLLEPDHHLVVPELALGLPRSIARRGLELRVLLKIYRAGHQAVLSYLNEITADRSGTEPSRDQILVYVYSRVDIWLDEMSEQVIATYYEERQKLHEGTRARRAAALAAILSDQPTSNAEASRALGHPVHAWQTALIIWSPEETLDQHHQAYTILQQAGELLGGSDPLAAPAGNRELRAWIATNDRPDLSVLTNLEEALQAAGLQLVAGLPAQGVGGIRNSHEEARAALDLVVAARSESRVSTYADLELLCLLAGRSRLTSRMVDRELGALATADKSAGLIRETLLAYLEYGLRLEATAQRLFVHKNTVRYRLAKAEELLGHPLSERKLHLELALRHMAVFGMTAPAEDGTTT
ncbi:PucR family transcriptional regulator [Saccharopolyspora shandongensis]|uniref:PucR family transcriptional regulator n=1 Tax=Saccharopolyspora shandongensis TaxID=418495 RepID=UPI0033D5378E